MTALQLDRLHPANRQLTGIIGQRNDYQPMRMLYKVIVNEDGVVKVQLEKKNIDGIYHVSSLSEFGRMKEQSYAALKHILINEAVSGGLQVLI